MKVLPNSTIAALFAASILFTASAFAGTKKECKYTAAPQSSLTITNQSGTIDVKPAPGRQVSISTITSSDNAQVDCSQVGSRISAVTRFIKSPSGDEGRVDYELLVPQDTSLSIRNSGGAIRLEGLRGDLTLRGDAAAVEVSNVSNSHLHLQTVNGPVTLTNIDGGHIEVLSTGGKVTMTDVRAPKVTASTTSGDIVYSGDFGQGGEYAFSNHSGAIDVTASANASVQIDARSVRGLVQNDLPLQRTAVAGNSLLGGHAFAGTSNSGSSSVELRSFSGTIRVKKH
jgi:DUF4097 and DUF4098 domain-containing protein YvlB